MQRGSCYLLYFTLACWLTACRPYLIDPASTGEFSATKALSSQRNRAPEPIPFPQEPPATCPVTLPIPPFIPPSPYLPDGPTPHYVWYGTAALWTVLPVDGIWEGLPHHPEGYAQKVLWWRARYGLGDEAQLAVTGQRLDAPAPPLVVSRPTNATAPEIETAMLVGVDFPTLGCWQITGTYTDTELRFVVWVTE